MIVIISIACPSWHRRVLTLKKRCKHIYDIREQRSTLSEGIFRSSKKVRALFKTVTIATNKLSIHADNTDLCCISLSIQEKFNEGKQLNINASIPVHWNPLLFFVLLNKLVLENKVISLEKNVLVILLF